MGAGQLGAVLRRLHIVADGKAEDQSDRHLLERFVVKKDDAAFAALLARHGRLVLGVCRSVLHQEQDAEDAFQATFLVLARMASSIRKGDSLASWLYGVALRTALKARKVMETRRRSEQKAGVKTPEQPASEAALRELQVILHEEVERLASKYRAPFVLCCLDGKSRAEAAQVLGWKEGTVSGRIAQARALLESRLARRGVALPAALTASAVAPAVASAAVPVALSSTAIRAAVAFAAQKTPAAVSARAAALAEGVIQAMLKSKLKVVTGVVLAVALVLSGSGLLAYATWLPGAPAQPQAHLVLAAPEPVDRNAKRSDEPAAVPRDEQRADAKGKPKPPASTVKIDVLAESIQPAGSPVLLRLLMTNTGKKPLDYWQGGPGNYLPVGYKARITDGAGKSREAPLSNGQSNGGSGISLQLGTGDSLVIPALLPPLPAGAYLIEVAGGKAKVTVKDDAELLKQREDDLLARIGNGEPFAQHAAAIHLTKGLRERLLPDLAAEVRETARQAVQTLWRVEKLPADVVPLLAKAMDKQLALELSRQNRDTTVLVFLTMIAGKIGSDEAMAPVLTLARSKMGGGTQAQAVAALGMFKQARAAKELRHFLKDADEDVRFEAARALAGRNDLAALNVLLAVAVNVKSRQRGFACTILARFPDDPRVAPAISSRLADPDTSVREEAQRAIEQLRRAQKK